MKKPFVQLFEKPFLLVVKQKESDSVRFETRKITYIGEFDINNVNKIFEYIFPKNEYMQRPISGKIPDFVATLRAFNSNVLIFEKTIYFDKI
jgi:hypothetical protein